MQKPLKYFVTTIFLIPLLFLTGCESAVSSSEKETVLNLSEPVIDNLFAGLTANDYALISLDFDTDLQEEIPESDFVEWKHNLDEKLGNYISRRVERVTRSDEFYVVNYQAKFALRETVKVKSAFHAADFSIAFLSFESGDFSWSTFE